MIFHSPLNITDIKLPLIFYFTKLQYCFTTRYTEKNHRTIEPVDNINRITTEIMRNVRQKNIVPIIFCNIFQYRKLF
jgi:hypothetical protein